MTAAVKCLELKMEDLEELLERARAVLGNDDYEKLRAVSDTLAYLTQLLEDKQTTLESLRRLLGRSNSEKTRQVLKVIQKLEEAAALPAAPGGDAAAAQANAGKDRDRKKQARGHGRNGADAYRGAEKICIAHPSLKSGDGCPECLKGKVYGTKEPGVLVRIVGQAPIHAKVYELGKLRCNLCGEVFTAEPPEGVGPEKYDATSSAMIALLKYGGGVPFYRQERLQESLGIPLPASTQWDIVQSAAGAIRPAYQELIRQAAQGQVLHNDDTSMKILALMGARPRDEAFADEDPERTGVFTTGIVATHDGWKIALFFTGRRHAGENLTQVLAHRAAELGPPIQMCDALSRNLPKELEAIVANCLAHCRRHFIDVVENFPEEVRHVLQSLGEVYKNDAVARELRMSPEDRLGFHQVQSGPLMEGLKDWLTEQLTERKVEPNSSLGAAISYFRRHWSELTLFLRVPGVPLDNNVCERALKKAILHRKNSLFYKTQNGAQVGDLFMSLVHTCQLCDANPFEYLTELQKHSAELSTNPQEWMPWNYRQPLERIGASGQAPG